MPPPTSSAFALPDHLAGKSHRGLVEADDRHFAAITRSLEETLAGLTDRLDAERRAPAGTGRQALDRDQQVHRLTARLRALSRFRLDLCLGRMVPSEGGEPTYVGRLGLTSRDGSRLLVDWRSPAAEPFFGATHATPMGLTSRRRYRWAAGQVVDYWDEVFTPDGWESQAALDDQSAFIASLGAHRSQRMRDVLGTIQADQDAIVRAGSRGALVVDGGPGTGKTVVALHRTAYLLYSDPRLEHRRGGVLVVGPHQPYLSYVSDVLPSLGEDGVRTCTLRDLVPEGAGAVEEPDAGVARLKSSAAMVRAIEPAVRLYEEPPTAGMAVDTDLVDLWVSPVDWVEAFESPDPGTPHNQARDEVWDALVTILVDKHDADEDLPAEVVRRSVQRHPGLREAFARAWPLIEPTDLVGDLWSVPAYLRRCAPWLEPDEVRALQRADPHAWTVSDLPLLDAARLRLGDPATSRLRRRQEAAAAAERERMSDVVDHLIAADDSMMQVMSMLRGDDLRSTLVDDSVVPAPGPDELAGPFAHVVVDEAQELTDAEWQVVLRRCPSRSLTIVGDRTQARHGFEESWEERLARVGIDAVDVATLTVNYRTPAEVMTAAAPVIRAVLPDANVPTSIRTGGVPVERRALADLRSVLEDWLAEHADGTVCVVATTTLDPHLLPASARVRVLTPVLTKGLEFDLVCLVDPEGFGAGIEGAVDRYVAMTRATQRLVVLASG